MFTLLQYCLNFLRWCITYFILLDVIFFFFRFGHSFVAELRERLALLTFVEQKSGIVVRIFLYEMRNISLHFIIGTELCQRIRYVVFHSFFLNHRMWLICLT